MLERDLLEEGKYYWVRFNKKHTPVIAYYMNYFFWLVNEDGANVYEDLEVLSPVESYKE